MKRTPCGESSSACGHFLTSGVGDLWLPAKLFAWGTEGFRGFDELAGFHERPYPMAFTRSRPELQCRVVFAGRELAERALSSTIPIDRKSTRLNSSHLG